MELSGITVLVVDDEPSVLLSVSMMLESRGCVVLRARSGEAAIETTLNESSSLDCIVMDYTMPILNGLQTLKKIRQADVSTPVIMCSGLPLCKENETASCWPEHILTKPFKLQELCDKVSELSKKG